MSCVHKGDLLLIIFILLRTKQKYFLPKSNIGNNFKQYDSSFEETKKNSFGRSNLGFFPFSGCWNLPGSWRAYHILSLCFHNHRSNSCWYQVIVIPWKLCLCFCCCDILVIFWLDNVMVGLTWNILWFESHIGGCFAE